MAFKSIKSQFNKVRETLVNETKKGKEGGSSFANSWEFKPKLINGKDATFRIRFLPISTPTGYPWICIRYHMFEREGDNKYIKCIDPRTFDKNAPNPIADLGWKLFKSDNAVDQDKSGRYRSKNRYFTVVYVKEAPEDQKHFEGKVLVFEAGEQVYAKMKSAVEKFNLCFYDPFEGADFILDIKETGTAKRKFPSYKESDFARETGPIVDDEGLMKKIDSELEKIDVSKLIIGRDKIPSEAQLVEFLEGGLKSAESAIDNGEEIVVGTDSPAEDFIVPDDDVPSTPAPKPQPKTQPKAQTAAPAQKPAAKPQAAPAPKAEEEEAKVDDLDDINFDNINLDDN